MSIIAWPGFKIRGIEWELDRPAQVNRSTYSGARQVVTQPGHARWKARVELAPIQGEARVLAWRAFLAKLRGQVNMFRLPASEADQHANGVATTTFSGSAVAGSSSATILGQAGAAQFKAGQMLTFNDQLVVLTDDSVYGAGTDLRVVAFEARLRQGAPHATPVESKRPTALVAMTESRGGWSVGPGQIYGVSFEVEEAF